jgi:CsoR family transcriptional regulator, copper-sensing transcriptional repressor
MIKDIKKQVLNRLNRIEGQIKGLRKMVGDEKYCVDIITQSSAVRQALSSVENLMLENHLSTHVIHQMKKGQSKKATEEVLKVYKLAKKR